jgi:hypothetical protein
MELMGNPNTEMLVFESYPDKGRNLLGRVSGDNCRRGYGLAFMRKTGQTNCAYCGIDLSENYEHWLILALDHVIPYNACVAWELPIEWREDFSNRVLCCTACNTFGNRYMPVGFRRPTNLEEFYELRDKIYLERRQKILDRHKNEREFFEKKPWAS